MTTSSSVGSTQKYGVVWTTMSFLWLVCFLLLPTFSLAADPTIAMSSNKNREERRQVRSKSGGDHDQKSKSSKQAKISSFIHHHQPAPVHFVPVTESNKNAGEGNLQSVVSSKSQGNKKTKTKKSSPSVFHFSSPTVAPTFTGATAKSVKKNTKTSFSFDQFHFISGDNDMDDSGEGETKGKKKNGGGKKNAKKSAGGGMATPQCDQTFINNTFKEGLTRETTDLIVEGNNELLRYKYNVTLIESGVVILNSTLNGLIESVECLNVGDDVGQATITFRQDIINDPSKAKCLENATLIPIAKKNPPSLPSTHQETDTSK
mmetsp:Transcript_33895/g.70470  ORF Transcript_33895/g.70470 Transcript_33895/m.70470 type:complete len:318 (-) Transcript_33895:1869-2822(-)